MNAPPDRPPLADDEALSEALLSKADALIRRNRPDGVSSDAEELPLLTEVVDDLPELTEAVQITEALEELDGSLELSDSMPSLEELLNEHQAAALPPALVPEPPPPPPPAGPTYEEMQQAIDEAVSKATANAVEQINMQAAERLIDLDSFISQSLEAWISTELPQIVASEMDGMVERMRMKTLAHMRATLLPELSEKLSNVLDATLKSGE